MIPTLPTELILYIQVLAEEGEPAASRLKTRARLERVCKEWYNMIDYFTTVIIVTAFDLARLTSKLRSRKMRDQFAAKTKTIIINGFGLSNMTLMNQLPSLVRWLTNTESIQIYEIDCGLDLSHPDDGKADRGKTLIGAFRTLKHVKHLELNAWGCVSTHEVWPLMGSKTFKL